MKPKLTDAQMRVLRSIAVHESFCEAVLEVSGPEGLRMANTERVIGSLQKKGLVAPGPTPTLTAMGWFTVLADREKAAIEYFERAPSEWDEPELGGFADISWKLFRGDLVERFVAADGRSYLGLTHMGHKVLDLIREKTHE